MKSCYSSLLPSLFCFSMTYVQVKTQNSSTSLKYISLQAKLWHSSSCSPRPPACPHTRPSDGQPSTWLVGASSCGSLTLRSQKFSWVCWRWPAKPTGGCPVASTACPSRHLVTRYFCISLIVLVLHVFTIRTHVQSMSSICWQVYEIEGNLDRKGLC